MHKSEWKQLLIQDTIYARSVCSNESHVERSVCEGKTLRARIISKRVVSEKHTTFRMKTKFAANKLAASTIPLTFSRWLNAQESVLFSLFLRFAINSNIHKCICWYKRQITVDVTPHIILDMNSKITHAVCDASTRRNEKWKCVGVSRSYITTSRRC